MMLSLVGDESVRETDLETQFHSISFYYKSITLLLICTNTHVNEMQGKWKNGASTDEARRRYRRYATCPTKKFNRYRFLRS